MTHGSGPGTFWLFTNEYILCSGEERMLIYALLAQRGRADNRISGALTTVWPSESVSLVTFVFELTRCRRGDGRLVGGGVRLAVDISVSSNNTFLDKFGEVGLW